MKFNKAFHPSRRSEDKQRRERIAPPGFARSWDDQYSDDELRIAVEVRKEGGVTEHGGKVPFLSGRSD